MACGAVSYLNLFFRRWTREALLARGTRSPMMRALREYSHFYIHQQPHTVPWPATRKLSVCRQATLQDAIIIVHHERSQTTSSLGCT